MGIHDAFLRVIGVDFFMHLFIGLKDGMYVRTEGEALTHLFIGLADEVAFVLG
jgi:hypothetical protein